MSGDYLWDRSGTPDRDVLYLERLLPRVRERVRRAEPSELRPWPAPRRSRVAVAALGLAAAAVLALGAWRLARPSPRASIRGEPAPAADAPALPSARPPERAPERPTPPPPPTPARLAPPAPVAKSAPPAPSAVADAGASEAPARSPAEIQAVVARHRGEVKERCWEPALAKRQEGAASTLRLGVSFGIEASGRVVAVKADASPPDYPGLASCVAAEVRGWSFGPAEAAMVVAVPFVFAEAR